ncbi:hypothetical protein [Bacillus cereus]|uniref:hypothetical protein n=1 Tax=Bacillus cereus TaxID=1396 RepID=UPI003CFCF848
MINYSIYFNNDHDGLGYIVPIIGIVIAFLYLAAVEKVPVIWSLIVSVAGGVIIPLIIQIAIIYCSFGFFSPTELKAHIWRNYAMDITSGFVYGMVAFILYSQDWSFKFDFEKIRFKREKHLVIGISLFGAVYVPATFFISHLRDIDLNLAFLAICSSLLFILLLSFAIKKEKSEIQYTKPITEVKTNV